MAEVMADMKQKYEVAQDGANKVGNIMDETIEGILPYEKKFPTSLFGCCGVKDRSLLCCATFCCCFPCSYSMAVGNDAKITWPVAISAAEKIPEGMGGAKIRGFVKTPGFVPCLTAQAGLAVFGCLASSMSACDCGITSCVAGGCTLGYYGYNHQLLVNKYLGEKEPMANLLCKTICCAGCLTLQDMNVALVKENTTWMVAPGIGCVGPKNQAMRLN